MSIIVHTYAWKVHTLYFVYISVFLNRIIHKIGIVIDTFKNSIKSNKIYHFYAN